MKTQQKHVTVFVLKGFAAMYVQCEDRQTDRQTDAHLVILV
jgi:hypothetical protein